MAILNGIVSKISGSAGNLTFRRNAGRTILSEKVTDVKVSRTEAQQRHRTKWANTVAMYKGIKPLINYGFENKPCNLSDYNMFVKVNMHQVPVYLTKQEVAGGACVAAPYQLTQGSLPAIVISGEGKNSMTDIFIAGLTINSSTTVADFSKAVVNNNPDYHYGDQISYFLISQNVNEATQIPYCQFKAHSVVLDAANTDKLWDIVPKNGFSATDGCLSHSGNDGDCVFAWVHSRKGSNGKILVSSQSLINANSKLSAYTSDAAYLLAANSYGTSKDVFLAPSGNGVESLAGAGGNTTPGGGDSL